MAVLILAGPDPQEFELAPITTVGRGTESTIELRDPLVSDRHAEIRRTSEGTYVLVDLGSAHGTFISGERVSDIILSDGDVIVVGSTRLAFQGDLSEEVSNPEAPAWIERLKEPFSTDEKFKPATELSETDLRRGYERLRAAYEMGRTIGAEGQLVPLLERILDTAFLFLLADRGAILIADPKSGRMVPRAAKQRKHSNEELIVSTSVTNYVQSAREGIISRDAGADLRFDHSSSVRVQGIRSVMCVPLLDEEDVLGLIYLDSKVGTHVFEEEDLALFTSIARQAAMAIRNASLRDQINHDALHHGLTGLPNWVACKDRVEFLLARMKQGGEAFGVFRVDLDRFKLINDGLGHELGDKLLTSIAQRLETCVRPTDLVGCLGGDEFALIIDGVASTAAAARAAKRVQKDLRLPFILNNQEIHITASMGVVVATPVHNDAEELLRDANSALVQAKSAATRGRHQIFDRGKDDSALSRLTLESDLRRAIGGWELSVHYQPIISLKDNSIVGVEALVRWRHPTRGLLAPAEFIPLAEETGLIMPLGDWVLREACRYIQSLPDKNLTVSVNLSPTQFLQTDLVSKINKALEWSGFDAERLGLEVTENTIFENPESASGMLQQLRTVGIELYLDDFGTGYSSLSYLHRFPFDRLKVDRVFVGNMEADATNREIIGTIVTLAHTLGMTVVAEGVDTEAQLEALRELGVDYAQGYHCARPVDGETLTKLLAGKKLPKPH